MGARFWWSSVALLLIFHSSGCNRVQEHERASTCEAGVGSAVCSGTRTESKKIRVAFVTHGMGVGGVERQILLTTSSVDRSKIHAEVVLFQERGVWAHHLEDMGIRVSLFQVWNPDSKTDLMPDYKSDMSRMVEYLKGFDVVHTWYGGGKVGTFDTFASHVARRARVPVVQNLAWNVVTPDLTVSIIVAECDEAEVLHGGNLEEMGIHAGHLDFLGVSHPMHQEIILQGKYHAAQMGEELAAGMTRSLSSMRQRCNKGEEQACIRRPFVVRIDPGLNLTRFDPEDERLSSIRSDSRSTRKVTVGRISRLVPEKDPESFVRAASYFVGREDVRFLLWGEGPERERLETLRTELGAEDILEMMGHTDDPEGALVEMDIFAYPTTGESVGWVVLEAMAMSLPVISTEVGAVPTFVKHGETGFLMDPGAASDVLAGLIETLVEDEDLRKTFGSRGRRAVEERFTLDRFGSQYTQLYESIASVDWSFGRD